MQKAILFYDIVPLFYHSIGGSGGFDFSKSNHILIYMNNGIRTIEGITSAIAVPIINIVRPGKFFKIGGFHKPGDPQR